MELPRGFDVTVRDHDEVTERRFSELLRVLAELDARPQRVITVTLDLRPRDRQQQERVRLFLRGEARRLRTRLAADGLGEIDRTLVFDLDRAEALLDERLGAAGATGGLALYLCEARDLALEVRTAEALPFSLAAGPTPSLRALVEGMAARPGALAAVADASATRLYRFDGTKRPHLAATVAGDQQRPKQGGWSPLAVPHRPNRPMDQPVRDAAAILTRLFDDSGGTSVLLGGQPEAHGQLESFLPERVRARLVRVAGLDPGLPDDRLTLVVGAALADHATEEALARLRHVEELAASGSGVMGLDPVLAALKEGRVARLLLDASLRIDGWSCLGCGGAGEGHHGACPDCGGATDPVELGEAMVRRAVLQDADVASLQASALLGHRGGVAAELRYPTVH